MRFIWMIFAGLLVLMVAVLPRLGHQTPPAPAAQLANAASRPSRPGPANAGAAALADSLVAFGLAQRGTPYVWAGISPLTGFDCSGFIMYTFGHFGVPVPHSTALLINVGRPVARADAQPGDIVVFTGTATTSTTAGHAGIVITRRGELPLRFVHASSSRREPFVKVSQVEDSDYERRFMQVRRVLGPGTGLAASARPQPGASPIPVPVRLRTSTPVAALPTRVVAVAPAVSAASALPRVLATTKINHPKRSSGHSGKPAAHRSAGHRPAVASKPKASKATPKAAAKASTASKVAAKHPARKTPVKSVRHR